MESINILRMVFIALTLLAKSPVESKQHKNAKPMMQWSPWGEWSECSRSCNVGLATRTRECREKYSHRKNYNNHHKKKMMSTCVGVYKTFKVCNIQECLDPNSKSFRAEQCEKFNTKVFHGRRRYRWEPYYNEKDECALTCRATVYNFYGKLARTVEDGTPCRKNSMDVCIMGKCQKVGCDGILGSEKQFDKCKVCGGDNTSCRVISGIYANQNLRYGYNNITLIPIGACNINITEIRHSKNYLALRTRTGKSIVNGNWAIDWSSDVHAAGTKWRYERNHHKRSLGEEIVASGPTNTTVDLYLLYNNHRNPGIMYTYSIPVKQPAKDHQVAQRYNNHRYGNTALGQQYSYHGYPTYSQSQTRVKVEEAPRYVASENKNQGYASLSGVERGSYSQGQSGYRRYRQGSSVSQGHSGTSQNRNYGYNNYRNNNNQGYSYQRGSHGVRYGVQPGSSNRYGTQSQSGRAVNDQIKIQLPSSRRNGYRVQQVSSNDYSWRISGFTECSLSCGGGVQKTIVVCVKGNSLAVVTDENCDNAIKPEEQTVTCNQNACPPGWHTGEWSECSTTCGKGANTRKVECKQRISAALQVSVSATLCGKDPRPASTKMCENNPECAEWKSGAWGACSVNCGHGTKERTVKCVDSQGTRLPDSECPQDLKPRGTESCDAGPCEKKWYFTKWSDQCSSNCGRGVYHRKVFCSGDKHTCSLSDKPTEEKSCQADRPCGGKWFTGEWERCTSCSGIQKRTVICMKYLHSVWTAVTDSNCIINEKPPVNQACQLEGCLSEWYTTTWGRCSKTCDGGLRERGVKCLDKDQKSSNHCKLTEKPVTQESCNVQPCPTRPPDPDCTDKYSNCGLVVRARLCRYPYYKNSCCRSCTNDRNKIHR